MHGKNGSKTVFGKLWLREIIENVVKVLIEGDKIIGDKA